MVAFKALLQLFWVMQFLLIFVLVLIGCGNPKPQSPDSTDGSSKKVSAVDALVVDDISGLYFEVGQATPFSGTAAWYYPNGKLMQETHIDGGREHGVERWWHSNGNRAGQCSYEHGLLDGPCVHWYPEESKRELQALYKAGKKDGVEITWYRNGREKELVRYTNGNKDGESVGWYETGEKASSYNWEKGELHGISMEWHRNGEKKSLVNYEHAKPVGDEVHWYESGHKSSETKWKNGLREGVGTQWYDGGQRMAETSYAKGLVEGMSTRWYVNGNKVAEEIYEGGELKETREYDSNGTMISQEKVEPPEGRTRKWVEGEIERYTGNDEKVVIMGFGDPDAVEGSDWVYNGVQIAGKECQVRFTVERGKIKAVRIVLGAIK